MAKTTAVDKKLRALKNEIKMSTVRNTEELEPMMREAIQRYLGLYIPNFGKSWDIILNEVYAIVQNNLPAIFFRTPRAFLKPRNKTFIAKRRDPVSGKMQEVQLDSRLSAKTQEDLLNYMIVEIKYKKEARKCLLDGLLFPHAVLWHGYKGDFGMTEEQSIFIKNEKIFVKRVSPMRFIFDPAVNMANLDEAKWVGRILDVPLVDLVEDDRLKVDQGLKGFMGFGEKIGSASIGLKAPNAHVRSQMNPESLGGSDTTRLWSSRKALFEYTDEEYKKSLESRFVKVYEIYHRPSKKEAREGKKGKIYLLIDEQWDPLRINDWSIKAEGFPSKILQFNELNDNLFGLSDPDTYSSIADQKNVITNLQIRNAQENSKVWVGITKENTSEEDMTKIREGQNTIITFEEGKPSDRMFVASPSGGASNELYLIDQRIQKNLDDKSGVSDLRRGFLQSGEESAASVKLRAAGGSARPAYRQDLMSDFLKESLHYLNQLNKQFLPYKDAVRIIGSFDLEWSQNPTKDEIQADTDVELDVISMLPENPEKELRELNTLLVMMMQGLNNPAFIQKLAEEGNKFNFSPVIEQMLIRMRLRDSDIFRNIRPEESEGMVSVQQIREARANVDAAIKGGEVPFPPQQGDDHVAKLEVYTSIQKLLQEAGQISDLLDQLIQIQGALLQEEQKQQATPGQKVNLSQPKIDTVGTQFGAGGM